MKISLDGGALCTPSDNQFGNYTFSKNLIEALLLYDKKNIYNIYSYCNKPEYLKLKNNFAFKKILPKFGWSKVRVSIEELVNKKNIYLALNQSIPFATFSKVISFSHGLSFSFYPGLYHNFARLNDQLEEMIDDSDKIVVSSLRVKNEMIELDRNVEKKICVIPFGIPLDMTPQKEVIKREKFFLHVAMDHPIKNIEFTIKAYQSLVKQKNYRDYKLYLIGYQKKFKNPLIVAIPHVSRKALKLLYQKTTALLTSSFYESFNLPVLEALSQRAPVIGLREAIVPELRPYVKLADDIGDFVSLMKKVIKNPKNQPIKKLAREFSWKNYITKLIKLYKV